jgi:hypothetical protein
MNTANQPKGKVVFRRIRGKIVPMAVAGAATVAAGAMASRSKGGKLSHPDPFYKYASYGTQIASGIVAAIPTKSKLGFALSMGGSVALDSISAALNAKSVAGMKGTKLKKAKAFAQQQAIGTGIGYGVYGAALLSRPDIRGKVASFLGRFSRKSSGFSAQKLLTAGL